MSANDLKQFFLSVLKLCKIFSGYGNTEIHLSKVISKNLLKCVFAA